MLGPLPCGPSFDGRPFSLSYGAILPSSLAMLPPPALGSSPHPPVSVYGTGTRQAIAAFPGTRPARFATPFRSASRLRLPGGCYPPASCACTGPPGPGPRTAACVPASSAAVQCRNLHLLPIGYASRPRLRTRLTQGRSALPWKPWIFGQGDSHPFLATHSGILSPRGSTRPYRHASLPRRCSPTAACKACGPKLRRRVSAPDIFGAGLLD